MNEQPNQGKAAHSGPGWTKLREEGAGNKTQSLLVMPLVRLPVPAASRWLPLLSAQQTALGTQIFTCFANAQNSGLHAQLCLAFIALPLSWQDSSETEKTPQPKGLTCELCSQRISLMHPT